MHQWFKLFKVKLILLHIIWPTSFKHLKCSTSTTTKGSLWGTLMMEDNDISTIGP
jgi:hypothetical protein